MIRFNYEKDEELRTSLKKIAKHWIWKILLGLGFFFSGVVYLTTRTFPEILLRAFGVFCILFAIIKISEAYGSYIETKTGGKSK